MHIYYIRCTVVGKPVSGRWEGRRGNVGPSFTTSHAAASGTR